MKMTHLWILAPVILAVILAYLPGVNGPFVLDDGENISLNPGVALKELSPVTITNALTSNHSGPLGRPLAALSFALNHYFSGGFGDTFHFKITNVLIHALNTVLVYFLALALTRTPVLQPRLTERQPFLIAGLATALWALHPIQLTNVLYVVQRMNSLSALFVLAGLVMYIHGRNTLPSDTYRGGWLMFAGVMGGMLFGLTAKENAILLPVLALVVEFCFYRQSGLPKRTHRFLQLFFLTYVVAPAALFLMYLAWHPEYALDGYVGRHFTLLERLLTETRILWHYIGLLLLPDTHRLGLFQDDIALSTGLLNPPSTLLAAISLLLAMGIALARHRTHPLISFSILWFLVGHSLESSLFSLELAYEHRNYLPGFGLFLSVAYAVTHFADSRKDHRTWYLLLPIAVVLVLGFATWTRATTWDDIHRLAETEAANHPDSGRANDFAARVTLWKKNDIVAATKYTLRGLSVAPYEVGFHIDLQILLANLTSEINTALTTTHAHPEAVAPNIQVQGLPKEIKVTRHSGSVRLSYLHSDSAAIKKLLTERPISVHAVVSLENLRRCVIETPTLCGSLRDPALDWMQTAAQNKNTARDYQGIIASNTAMLYAHRGDYGRALEYIDAASRILPGMLSYRLGKTEYLTRLGRVNEASSMLDDIAQNWQREDLQSEINRSAMEKLAGMLKDARQPRQDRP